LILPTRCSYVLNFFASPMRSARSRMDMGLA
jgi:hypothetical protein